MSAWRWQALDAVLDPRERALLRRKQALTRLAIVWENLVPVLWLPAGIVMIVAGLGLTGLFSALPAGLHLILLILASGLVLYTLIQGLRHTPMVEDTDVLHRLEASAGDHRPLTAVNDRLSAGADDPAAEALWQAHRRRMAARIGGLRVLPPEPRMAARDPYALRIVAVMVLAFGLAVSGGDRQERLLAAFSPALSDTPAADPAAVLEAWVTPPAYTGYPPIFLSATADAVDANGNPRAVDVPEGSRFLARYHGAGSAELVLHRATDDPAGRAPGPVAFDQVGDMDQQSEQVLTDVRQIVVTDSGQAMAAWPVRIIPDVAPQIAFTEPPRGTLRGALRIAYRAGDDYGVSAVTLRITRLEGGDTQEFVLPQAGTDRREVFDTVFRDLSAHPWAGTEVQIELMAADDAGQTGMTEAVQMLLPAREFKRPAARVAVELRRFLANDPDGRQDWVVRAIRALQINPKRYDSDFAVHMVLSMIARDLTDRTDAQTRLTAQDLLWETALRIEDGNVSMAQRRLREIQEQLAEALANGASDQEIQRLMDALQTAMDEYLQAMQQEAMRRMEEGDDSMPGVDENRMIGQDMLSDMLDRARELSESGARDAARQMLSQLQNLLENLQMGNQARTGDGQQQTGRMVEELGRMMEQQQQLMDRTFENQQRRSRPGARRPTEQNPFALQGENGRQGRLGRRGQAMPGGQGEQGGEGPGGDGAGQQGLMDEQRMLRRQLGDLMRRLGEAMGNVPGELGEADEQMRAAERALRDGDGNGAVDNQGAALDRLRQGTESVLQDLAERGQGEGQNQDGGGRPGAAGENTDPLGRAGGDTWGEGDGDVVPDRSALQRSREILDELRRRSGQSHRSPDEHDYIRRLLRQF